MCLALAALTALVPLWRCCARRGIWGTAGIDGLNIDPAIRNDGKLQQIEVGLGAAASLIHLRR
jgi:hypothetical protein